METEIQTVSNGAHKKNVNGTSTGSAVEGARAARAYAESDDYAAAFDAEKGRIIEERRHQLARLEGRIATLPAAKPIAPVLSVTSTKIRRAVGVVASETPANAVPVKAGRKTKRKAKTKGTKAAAAAAQVADAALKAIDAAGKEGIAARALGTLLGGVRPGPVVKAFIDAGRVTQRGTAGATRYLRAS